MGTIFPMMYVLVFLFPVLSMLNLWSASSERNPSDAETYQVTMLPAMHGRYTVSPQVPADGKVPAGTVLTIKASPDQGYRLDAVFYTYKGGMWGTLSKERFMPEMKVTVDRDMSVGATFIPASLVDNLQVTQDVVYAKPGVKALKYDVYAPKGAKNLPCIVIIHGGGWSSNNEDIMRGLARELARGNQYVVVSIDYRWINKLDGDEQPTYMHQLIEDVLGAIAHIREHAAQYGIDPNRLAVTGDSAGGHLSECAALFGPFIGDGGFGRQPGLYQFMPTYLPKGKNIPQVGKEITQAIKAVAPSYGPSEASLFKQFLAQTDQLYWDAISPIKHIPNVKDRALPHFIVRGTLDPVVSKEAVTSYVEKLKAAGQRVEHLEIEGAGHAFFDWKPDAATIGTFEKIGVPYAAKMKAFFDSIFYPGKKG
jgi:acetyl esterase/lipase